MSPAQPVNRETIDGDLTEAPPSDLSEYTWDDSETERLQREAAQARKASAKTRQERAIGQDFDQFVATVIETRLVPQTELRAVAKRIFSAGEPHDPEALAAELVRLGKLTAYQAAAIRQGKTKGLLIGDYIVLTKIGSGGMGLVLKARHRQRDLVVALKLLPPSFSRDRAAVIRFRREATAIAKFRHPNLVSAIDSGETHGLLFMVMEFVDGRDFSRIVKEKGPLPVTQTIDCIIQAARGLQEAHDHGIIHRDIKPANLLLDSSGTVKVLDLGLARMNQLDDFVAASHSGSDLTVSGAIMGTVDYMSPEQAYDARTADGRSDIYSLGCTLHFLLTGRAPFGGETFMERLLGHRERPIPSLRKSRRDVSPVLDATFHRLMAKSPQDRPQTMAAVIDELHACRISATTEPQSPVKTFHNRGDETAEPESIYEIARPQRDSTSPRSEVLSTVFVRNRGSSSERRERSKRSSGSESRHFVTAILILVALLIFGWYLFRKH
jgi:serine/threonine protein kinase